MAPPRMPLMRVTVPYRPGFCSYVARVPTEKLAKMSGMMIRLDLCMILADVCCLWSIPGSFLYSAAPAASISVRVRMAVRSRTARQPPASNTAGKRACKRGGIARYAKKTERLQIKSKFQI